MSTVTLAISCLATSNLPWFVDLTFQVLMQYCSLQHQTLLLIISYIHTWVLFLLWLHLFIPSGVISPIFSSSLLGIHQPGEFIFQCPFWFFILFMGFSKQDYWSVLPFLSPVDHVLSELSTISHPSWVGPTRAYWATCYPVRENICFLFGEL